MPERKAFLTALTRGRGESPASVRKPEALVGVARFGCASPQLHRLPVVIGDHTGAANRVHAGRNDIEQLLGRLAASSRASSI